MKIFPIRRSFLKNKKKENSCTYLDFLVSHGCCSSVMRTSFPSKDWLSPKHHPLWGFFLIIVHFTHKLLTKSCLFILCKCFFNAHWSFLNYENFGCLELSEMNQIFFQLKKWMHFNIYHLLWDVVGHVCNHSCSGGKHQRSANSRPVWAMQGRPYLKNKTKKGLEACFKW
jgi:hypothetical protein